MNFYGRGPERNSSLMTGDRVDRLPTLEIEKASQYIKFIHHGRVSDLIDYSSIETSDSFSSFDGLHLEVTGPPKIFKTTMLMTIEAGIRKLDVPVNLIKEARPSFSPDDNLYDYNLAMTLICGALLTNSRHPRTGESMDKIHLWDRSVLNALPFLYAYYLGKNERSYNQVSEEVLQEKFRNDPLVKTVGYLSQYIHGLILVNASPQLSIAQGSRVDEDYLKRLSVAYQMTPQLIAQIREDAGLQDGLPLALFNADKEGQNLEDLLFQTVGCLARQYYKRDLYSKLVEVDMKERQEHRINT